MASSSQRTAGYLLAACGLLGAAACCAAPAAPTQDVVRIGITEQTAEGVSFNDIKAATKAWGESIGAERNLAVLCEVGVYSDVAVMKRDTQEGRLDIVTCSTPDFLAMGGHQTLDTVFLESRQGEVHERYVLLARRDGPVKSLADLKGVAFGTVHQQRSSLALPWLNDRLQAAGLPPVEQLAGSVLSEGKVSAVALKVFFRKTAACLVTARGYATMVELNPQVGRELAVLAESPPFVPSVIAFRADFDAPIRKSLEEGVAEAHLRPKGQQVLNVYRIDRLVAAKEGDLDSAIELIRRVASAPAAAPAIPTGTRL